MVHLWRPNNLYACKIDMMIYKDQRQIRKIAEKALPYSLPPSSPPNLCLLNKSVIMQITAQIQNTATLNPREPAGTK
jgi:hypothetical protein